MLNAGGNPRRLGVIGDLVEDVVVWQAEPLRYGSDTRVQVHRARGGSAANVAVLAAPHYPTVFIGCVGADPTGDRLVADLERAGVAVRVQRRGHTGTIVVLVDEQGERTMLPDRGAALELQAVDPVWTTDLTHVHIPAYTLVVEPLGGSARAVADRVRTAGGTVSVDASSTALIDDFGATELLRLLAEMRVRYLFANRDEAHALDLLGSGRSRVPDTIVVVKNGADHTVVLAPGSDAIGVPVPPVPVVRDLTGAGDAFAAGFLAATCTGAGLPAATEAGHANAARVLGNPGAAAS